MIQYSIINMYKNFLNIIFIPLIFSTVLFPQEINLEQAISIALNKNDKVLQYREKLEQKKYQEMEAWGNFLPQVDIQASYNHLNDPMQIDLNPIRDVILNIQAKNQTELTNIYGLLQGKAPLSDVERSAVFQQSYGALNNAIPSFKETFKEQDYRTATVIGVQPLFTGGKLYAAKKYASDEKISAKIELKKTENEIIQETVNSYLTIVVLQNVVKTRKNVLSGVKKHRDDAEKLFKQGIIANYHLLRADVALAEAEKNLFDDSNKLDLAKTAFVHLIGVDFNSQISISDTLTFNDIPDSIEFYLNSALQNQPLLKLIEKKKDAVSDKFIAERANFLPQIAAFGKYEILPEYLSSLEPRWAVGIQMKLNLFNGFRDYSKLQNSKHLKREVNFIEADAKRKIDLWVKKAFKDFNNSKIKYLKQQNTIKLAEENLRMNTKRFQSGMGTSLEVVDAQLLYEKNKIESLTALYEYYRSLNDLLTASGNPKEILKVWNEE